MNKNIPLFLMGICHGAQEKILFQSITNIYLDAIYSEISESSYDPINDNPIIRILSRNRVEKISVSTYKKDIKEKFPCDGLDYDIPEIILSEGEFIEYAQESLAFITFIDFNEKNQNTASVEQELMKDNGLKIIEELMEESKEEWLNKDLIHSTLIIHADGALERWLPGYENTNDKLGDTRRWFKENILKLDNLNRSTIRKVIEQIDKNHYNLIDYLNFLDEIFKEYLNGN